MMHFWMRLMLRSGLKKIYYRIMKTVENEHYIQFESRDENGKFFVRLHKDSPIFQLTLSSSNEDEQAFVNLDLAELKAIRDMINKVIGA